MRIDNQKLMRTLSLRALKASRARNIVAVIAIALTATLFTSIFAIGGNIAASIQESTMRQVGTSAHGGFKYLTQAQYDHIKESPLIEDISFSRIISAPDNEALQRFHTEIRYTEDKDAEWGWSMPTVGDLPRAGLELACSTATLDALGIPHEVGQKVPLEFTAGGKKYSEEFTLSGFWPQDDAMAAAMIFLSGEYADAVAPVPDEMDLQDASVSGDYTGAIMANFMVENSFDIESKIDAVAAERGYAEGELKIGVNWAYISGDGFDATTLMLAAFLLIIILVSGYLIIYSVFSISVAGDIRFYGMLKTIGATGGQLRRVVRRQALALSLFGIPLGFLLGYLLGYALTPALMSGFMSGATAAVSSVNPLIFLFAGAFSLATVFISCRKPEKVAAGVSPMEALRYSEVSEAKRKEKRARKVSPASMALSNTARRPKTLIVVTLSISLSMILLSSVYSLVRGFDMDIYLKDYIETDFAVSGASTYNAMVPISERNYDTVDADTRRSIEALPGLEGLANIYFHEDYMHKLSPQGRENMNAIEDELNASIAKNYPQQADIMEESVETDTVPLHVYGAGALAVEALPGDIDFEKLSGGDYILVSEYMQGDTKPAVNSIYSAGDKVTLTNAEGETREFETLAVLSEYPYALSCRHSHDRDSTIVMADNVWQDFYGEKDAMLSVFNVADEHIEETDAWLSDYTASGALGYSSRDSYKAEFENLQRTFMMAGGALAGILALIGIVNFVNAIFTSIAARRRELAVLQSVGMTDGQLKKMLFFEGLAYAVLTILFSVTAGAPIIRLIVQGLSANMWFFSGGFSITPTLVAIPVLALICAVVPLICNRFMSKTSVWERLRAE
jgi:putative ABC transport system permease protein